ILLEVGNCSLIGIEVPFSGTQNTQGAEGLLYERTRDLFKLASGNLSGQAATNLGFRLNLIEDSACDGDASGATAVSVGRNLLRKTFCGLCPGRDAKNTTFEERGMVALPRGLKD